MHQKIRESWKIGEPSWIEDGGDPLRFLGMEIEKKGQDLAIHQRAYLESLFLEYDEQGKGSLGQVKTREEEENPQLAEVTQALASSCGWLGGRDQMFASQSASCASGPRRDREP